MGKYDKRKTLQDAYDYDNRFPKPAKKTVRERLGESFQCAMDALREVQKAGLQKTIGDALQKMRERWDDFNLFEGIFDLQSQAQGDKIDDYWERRRGAERRAMVAEKRGAKGKEEAQEIMQRWRDQERGRSIMGDRELVDLIELLREDREQHEAAATRTAHQAENDLRFETGAEGEQEPPEPSRLKKMAWYHKSYAHGLIPSPGDRLELGNLINKDFVVKNAKRGMDYIAEKCRSYQVVVLGESATSEGVERRRLAELLAYLKQQSGLTDIGLEIENIYQDEIDFYLQYGTFDPAENEETLEKKIATYQRLQNEMAARDDVASIADLDSFFASVQSDFLFKYGLADYYPILKKARGLGIRVHCIEARTQHATSGLSPDETRAIRDVEIYQNIEFIASGMKQKLLILADGARLAREEHPAENLGDMLAKNRNLQSFRIHLDRDFDSDRDLARMKQRQGSRARPLNSVLFNALGASKTFGIDLSSTVFGLKKFDARTIAPFDGYVKIQ